MAVLLVALLLAAMSLSVSSGAAQIQRPEYVAQLEKICKPRSEATTRAVRGMRSDIQSERFQVAARKFTTARRIFAGTIRVIAKVPRPVADRPTLARWFSALEREAFYLQQSALSLRAENVARFQRVSGQFFAQGTKSNHIVVSFGFNYCAFKSSRYE